MQEGFQKSKQALQMLQFRCPRWEQLPGIALYMDQVTGYVYAMSIVVAVMSAFVLSGAPGGGLVGEMLIVSLFGFPAEAFPLIATLGFLFDPAATCLNASGDTLASMMVARLVEGKDWLKKAAVKTEQP